MINEVDHPAAQPAGEIPPLDVIVLIPLELGVRRIDIDDSDRRRSLGLSNGTPSTVAVHLLPPELDFTGGSLGR